MGTSNLKPFTTRIEDVPFEYVDDDSGERVFTNRTLTLYDYPVGTTVQATPFIMETNGGRTNGYPSVVPPLDIVDGFRLLVPIWTGTSMVVQQLTGLTGAWLHLGMRHFDAHIYTYAEIFPANTPGLLMASSASTFIRIS